MPQPLVPAVTGTRRRAGNSSQVNERRDEPSAARTPHSCPVPHQAPQTLAAPREALPGSLAMGGLGRPVLPLAAWPRSVAQGPAGLVPALESCWPRSPEPRNLMSSQAGQGLGRSGSGPRGRRPDPCGDPIPLTKHSPPLAPVVPGKFPLGLRVLSLQTQALPKTLPPTAIGRHSTQSWEEEEQEEGSPPSSSLLCPGGLAGGCNAQVPSGTPLWGQQRQAGGGPWPSA